ncbi:salicylate hydroxylase [Crucibulum laeve]|uniref:Salicylate hydroxylase n=1 Tax=Crucibulum laeve TaxID=68775 RepID=A0A5C3MLC7_9AGAR|nr:salicylate hydroxylase [Crucibulum laeve]
MVKKKDFNVAIVGGGVCGLTCAATLEKYGIDYAIFEAAPKFGEVGAGVGFGPNAVRVLKELDLLDRIATENSPVERSFVFISGTGEHELVHKYARYPNSLGLGVYRPDFLDALAPLIDPSVTHFSKRCISVSPQVSGRHTLHFSDGTTYEADLVVGADGIKSVTRDAVVGLDQPKHLSYTNTVAYRGLVPIETLKAAGVKTDLVTTPLCWVGMGKHLITFPIQAAKTLNIVAFVADHALPLQPIEWPSAWVEVVPEEELVDQFEGWGNDAMTILRHMKQPSKWHIHAVNPTLPSFIRENIVLAGDAAHGMLPHLGAGAGQGLEDIFVLCRLLCHEQTNATTLQSVLKAYNSIRPQRANMVSEESSRMGGIYDNFGESGYDIQAMQNQLRGMWEPVWQHDIVMEVDAALELLHGKII